MSKQETDTSAAEQKEKNVDIDDLPVESGTDDVKGGIYRVPAIDEAGNR